MEILFIRQGSFSKINDNVYHTLQKKYPQDKIVVINAIDIIKNKISYYHYIINIYFFITEYSLDILLGHKKWRDILVWFFATSYVSLQIGYSIKKLNTNKKYKFTIQTQSLFNAKIDGIPHFIYTDHTVKSNLLYPDINPKEHMRSKRFIRKSEFKIFQDATMIFTFGNFITNSLINQYDIPKEKIATVFAGSNVKDEPNQNPSKYYSKNILFVGINWERKGGPVLLEVFQRVLKFHPDASLTIIGCNPNVHNLSNCNVLGKIPVEEVSKYYHSASIFFLPTLREPFGIVFVEAMSFKLPIIANNIGCIPDMVKNDFTGFLTDNNVADYTKVVCRYLETPEHCREMGENGYLQAKSNFTWDVVGEKMKNKIDSLLRT